jgi:hypothetical protein
MTTSPDDLEQAQRRNEPRTLLIVGAGQRGQVSQLQSRPATADLRFMLRTLSNIPT